MSELKELTKELCEESVCHHKCPTTDDCIVEDEAKELFKQALVEGLTNKFDKIIEEAKKIEQIEEMAEIIHKADVNNDTNTIYFPLSMAECLNKHGAKRTNASIALYNAGYRKQSEGEWKIAVSPVEATFICSKCGYFYIEADPQAKTEYKYCPHCGSKMKGDEE